MPESMQNEQVPFQGARRVWRRQLMHLLPLTDLHQPAYVYITNRKVARNEHPRIAVSIHRALFLLLAFAGETWALENTRYTFVTPVPEAPVDRHQSHPLIFWPSSNCIINSRCDTEYTELLARTSLNLRMKINQFYLLLEVIPSRQSFPWMVWTICPGESVPQMSERETEGRERRVSWWETNDSGENAPRGECGRPGHWTMSNVHRRHGKELPLLRTPSSQAPNLKFQPMAVYFFFYKKLGSETLEPESEIFSAHLSLPVGITVDIFMPAWLQTIKFSSLWRLERS